MSHDPRLTPARPDLAAAHLRGIIPAARHVEGRILMVTAPVLDMTATPDRDAGLSTQLLMGEAFLALEEDHDTGLAWGQAQADGYVGYVSLAGLEVPGLPVTHQVTALATHLYPEPALKIRPLEGVPFLARVAVTGTRDGYAAIATGGYCTVRHLGPIGAVGDDFVTIAEKFVGVPYVWGGKSSYGLDCSALVQLSLAATGQAAPRDSDLQSTLGGAAGGSLRRGDLIFWAGHCGIMRDAETLLHANAHHMAVVSEPLAVTEARIVAAGGGGITARRRL